MLRSLISRLLGIGGHRVVEAATGAEALAALERDAIDVALLDGKLPDTHGVHLARRILADPAAVSIPICLVSGDVGQLPGAEAGVAALIKPVGPADLRRCITDLLRWRNAGGSPVEERTAALDRVAGQFFAGS